MARSRLEAFARVREARVALTEAEAAAEAAAVRTREVEQATSQALGDIQKATVSRDFHRSCRCVSDDQVPLCYVAPSSTSISCEKFHTP